MLNTDKLRLIKHKIINFTAIRCYSGGREGGMKAGGKGMVGEGGGGRNKW